MATHSEQCTQQAVFNSFEPGPCKYWLMFTYIFIYLLIHLFVDVTPGVREWHVLITEAAYKPWLLILPTPFFLYY